MIEKRENHFKALIRILGIVTLTIIVWNGNAVSYSNALIFPKIEMLASPVDSSKFKKEEPGSFVQETNENRYILPPPSNIERKVEYDPKTNKYIITEKVNGVNVKPPMYMTFDEYAEYVSKKENTANLQARNKTTSLLSKKNEFSPVAKLKEAEQGMFGEGGIEVKPQGNLQVLMGYTHNTIKNPQISPIQQSQGVMDFDMNINLSVMGKIGDKFQNTLQFNNQAGFGFEGQRIKLGYRGKEDEIVRNLEAGDVSFDVPTQLITGSQSLFGIKSELQFGKLNLKTVLSQQRGNKQSKVVENGAEVQRFEITADQYDVNKHFFLSQFFRDNYEKSLKNLPLNSSQFQILNCEVWITNRSTVTQSIRDAVAFQDLGEAKPYSSHIVGNPINFLPSNESNDLYGKIKNDQNVRNVNTALNTLQTNYNLASFQDFEKSFMRKLSPSEFILNSQLGYISLNTNIQANDVLAVSFQYSYNGKIYQVGDLSRDITLPDTSVKDPGRLVYLKLLKGTNVNPTYPIWDLMMKNIYSLNAYQVSQQNFRLDVYYNDPGGGLKRYLPKGNLQNEPMIRVFNLDRLNQNNEPFFDGVFDYVPNVTIIPNNGKIIFPVLEPFGSHLKQKLISAGNSDLTSTYVYQQLYDSTQFVAQQFPEFNRFVIKGTYQSASNKRIQLGGFGIPEGSVTVSLNGQRLIVGQDYTIEYGLGYVELQDHILNSGGKIQIDFESNAMFSLQQKNFMGLRAEFRENENFKIGATYEKLSERPFNNKIQFGEDPISNQMIGGDLTYNTKAPFITKLLDKLPFYTTNESSNINFYGEVAHLIPGHFSSIGDEGTIYIDDFEAASVGYNFGSPPLTWRLASTPKGAKDANGRELFQESKLFNDLKTGYNRAKLAWYTIATGFYFSNSNFPTLSNNVILDIYQRQYRIKDVFPQRSRTQPNDLQTTIDLAFFPKERGPYNYEFSKSPTPGVSQGVNPDNTLKAPETRWAGIQKAIDNTNFETNNIEYIQFWLLDPFVKNPNNKGDLYFNLGYISEDVLKDSRMAYEHGLYDKNGTKRNLMAQSNWATVPNITPTINAFDNDPNLRPLQDLGYDGYDNAEENNFFSNYLTNLQNTLNPAAYAEAQKDPSSDNFVFYLNSDNINQGKNIIGLYKNYNNPENNTPVSSTTVPQSSYTTPDNEDLNRDNTLNENEAYFQYRVGLFPGMNENNHPYIVSTQVSQLTNPDPSGAKATWYQFRIPIKQYDHKVGEIGDFRNIQFIRMFLTNFSDSVILRFTEMDFIRNQWRKYEGSIQGPTDYLPQDNNDNEFFNIGGVGLEENASKVPVNYLTPPNILREVGVNSTANPIQLNEQALRMNFCNLKDGDAKACFKNLQFDFRQFKKIKMFFHAEQSTVPNEILEDNEISAFLRLGSDFKENYYEYEIPLKVTPAGNYVDASKVWPDSNQMIITLEDLVNAKYKRNGQRYPVNTPFVDHLPTRNITVVGNPDLGSVKVAMIGIRNRAINDPKNFITNDDGLPKCGEVWANELRLEGLNEEGGTAALANISLKLADLGTANVTTSMHTVGFGQINQRVNERKRDDYLQYTFNTQLQLGKFFPKKWGVQLPFFAQFGRESSTPQFDPFYLDIKTKNQRAAIELAYGSDSADRYYESILTTQTTSGFNFSGVRILPESKKPVLHPFTIRNFSASYAFTSNKKTSPFVEQDWIRTYSGELQYNFAAQPKYIEPFKKLIKSKSKSWDFIKNINFNLVPSTISVTNQINRQFGVFQQRRLPDEIRSMDPQYLKNFTWNRNYRFSINPIRPMTIDFSAKNLARIDEPQGGLNRQEDVDSIWRNIKKFGRTTQYNQTLSANYNLPIAKIPILDFITASLNYSSGYNWNTGPQIIGTNGEFIQSPQGNTIDNSQSIGTKANIKMNRFYQKFAALKKWDVETRDPFVNMKKEQKTERIEQNKTQIQTFEDKITKAYEDLDKLKAEKKEIRKNDTMERKLKKQLIKQKKESIKKQKAAIKELKKQRDAIYLPPSVIIKTVVQPLMAVRDIDLSYQIDNKTTLPGFNQKTKYFGVDFDQQNHLDPGFTFGMQPGIPLFAPPDKFGMMRWLENAGNNGMITKDTLFNMPMMQSNVKAFTGRLVLEPFKTVKINLNWKSSYTQNYTEIFKFNNQTNTFEHLNPIESGSYTYSDINLLTSFNKLRNSKGNNNLELFNQNRQTYAKIFYEGNLNRINSPYFDPIDSVYLNQYYMGYGPLQQDVLINSFLTTYRGQQATRGTDVSPFSRVPLPNWDLTYTGIKDIPAFRDIFTNFTVKHGYNSETSIGNFTSELRYFGDGSIKNPIRIDSLNNNFIPLYYIPSISMTESYNPLIGVDFRLKNSLKFGFQIRSRRQVMMSLIDYQITENESNDLTMSCGFTIKNLKLPISRNGKKIKLENDVNVDIQFTMGDNDIINYKMGQNIETVVGGQFRWTLSPKIDYKVNDKFNVSIFYNHTYTEPKLSNAFPQTNIAGGIKMNFSLAP